MNHRYLYLAALSFALSGCWAEKKTASEFYDRPFRLTESTSASVFNANASLETNKNSCRTRLSCVGNAVSKEIQTYDVLQIKQNGPYWRSVIVQNNYIPQLDIAFDIIENGVDVAGRVDGDGSSLLWQLLKPTGTTQCLLPGPCQNSQSTVTMSGKGDDAKIRIEWPDGRYDVYSAWVGYCGPLEPCEI